MDGYEPGASSAIGQTSRNAQNMDDPCTGINHGHTNQHLASTGAPAATSSNLDRLFQDQVGEDVSLARAGTVSLFDVLQDPFPILSQGASGKQSKRNKTMGHRHPKVGLAGVTTQSPGRPAIPPAQYEIYVRTMLTQGYGLPCWEPRPLDPQAQPQGVVPGDVGTYTAESGFRRSFNLFDDARTIQEITQRPRGCPGNEFWVPGAKLSRHPGILREGDVCVHGSSLKPDQKGGGFEFHRDSGAPAGAILVSVSSADEVRSDDIKGMGEYIRQHAEAIYRHAFSIRPIGKQESLYIVTGCMKSDSWATAVYRQGMDANHGATLLLVPAVEASSGHPPQYEWTMQGSSRARAGWSDREGVKDQCLFLQGFKVAFSPSFRSRVSSRCSGDHAISPALLQAQRGEGHQDQAVALRQGPRPGEQRNPHTRTIPGSRRLLSSKNSDTAHTNNTHGILCTPFPPRSQTVYHPSDAINAWLLQQPGCDIAICHDDSWRFFFKSCSSQRVTREISQEDRSETTDDLGHRAFEIQNGVALLLPNTCQAEQTILHKTNVFENPTTSSSQRLHPSDVVVLIMGIAGAGKSTFINNLLPVKHNARKMSVGHGLEPCTTTTKCVILESQDLPEILGVKKDYRLVLVDTPGVDFTAGSAPGPKGVRQDIVTWSKSWLPIGQKPRGCAIFMRDINSNEFEREHAFTSFGSTFSLPSNLPRLIIVTSKLEIGESEEAEKRHKRLAEQFKQAEVHRLTRREDAREVMKNLLPRLEGGSMLNLEGEDDDTHGKKKSKSLKSWVCMDSPEMM